jgi:hypothetical protein
MTLKITLIKPKDECNSFLKLLVKHKLYPIKIFANNDKKFQIEGDFSEEVKKELHDCEDVFDFIVKTNSELEDVPL